MNQKTGLHARASSWATLCLAATVAFSVNAHELPEDATPADYAFAYRDGLFHAIGWKAGVMSNMARGNAPADPALFAKSARDIATLAPFIHEGFIPDSIVEGSLAKPEIWDNFDDFKEKAEDMQKAALNIADVAEKDFKKAAGMMRKFGGTCGACHREYKVDTD